MDFNLKQFIDGWTNLIKKNFGNVDPELLELSEKRITICKECPLFRNNVCNKNKKIKHAVFDVYVNGCGCSLPAKTICKDCHCPAAKW